MIKKYSVGIILAFALIIIHLLYTGFINQHLIGDFAGRETKFLISRIIMWVILFIVFLYAKKIEKQYISLWTEKKYSLKFYLKSIPIAYFLAVGGAGVASVIIHLLTKEGVSSKIFEATAIFKNSYYLLILTCLTAAVTEEYIMRGYIQTRLTKIYNNQWI